ncbi:MAG: nucleotide exchange factor GrpE [Acutalibacteraceae bacterium]|nr:nucleotide exchange factor GrpE [Acutalibacteraceae bacterium]
MSKKDEKKKATKEKEAENKKETEAVEEAVEEQAEEKTEEKAEETAESKLEKELKAKTDAYLRMAAEYENYRRRTTADKANIYADATANAIKEILPIGDSLDMALKTAENAPDEYKKGLELICNQFKTSLEKLNVEVFGNVGDEFNPEIHNCVMKVEDDDLGENTVAQVFQKGYKTGNRIIRQAMVQVANYD